MSCRVHFASAKWAGDPSADGPNGLENLSMRLALYEPDIPQNAGTILRLAACLGVAVDVIQPAGFDMTDRALRRAGLDYLAHVQIEQHQSFAAFDAVRRSRGSRLVLLTTRGAVAYTDFAFVQMDTLLLGRESAGVPQAVHADRRRQPAHPDPGRITLS